MFCSKSFDTHWSDAACGGPPLPPSSGYFGRLVISRFTTATASFSQFSPSMEVEIGRRPEAVDSPIVKRAAAKLLDMAVDAAAEDLVAVS